MNILILNILRGVKKRFLQYFGIFILITTVTASISGLYETSERISSAFYTLANKSGDYDYRVNTKAISDYKDLDKSLEDIKSIIKFQFFSLDGRDHDKYTKIIGQVDELKVSDIQNNLLPTVSTSIDDYLKTYLLNWGVDYDAILINNIIINEVKNNPSTKGYDIQKSFLKYFSYENKSKNSFFNFEDAFYLSEMPFPPTYPNTSFDFSPTRDGFNTVWITAGRKPLKNDETVINPDFAANNNIKLNDTFGFLPGQKLFVVGLGYSYWGVMGEQTVDNINPSPSNTTQVFTTREWLNDYLGGSTNEISSVKNPFLLKVSNKDSFFANRLEGVFNDTFNFNYGMLVTYDSEDLRGGALKQNFTMENIVFSAVSGVVLFMAIFIVLSYVRKEIDLQKKQIGLLKALGYSNNKISSGFTVLIFLITLISTIVGFALGLALQLKFNSLGKVEVFLPLETVHFSLIALLITVIFVPLIFIIASYWQSITSLRKDPLFLIYDQPSSSGSRWLAFFKKPFSYWSFKPRLAISFALKSFGKLILIFFIFTFVSFLLLFQSVTTDIFNNKIDGLYGYLNKDVFSSTPAISIYKTNSGGTKNQIYDWGNIDNLDPNKAIKSDTFYIDSAEKYTNLMMLLANSNLKDYYINSTEMNLLYHNTQPDTPIGEGKCFDYIKAGQNFIDDDQAKDLATSIDSFFSYFIRYTGIDPSVLSLPGVSIGQNIIDNNYYPNLEFIGHAPTEWIGHQQGPLRANWVTITTLYNNNENSLKIAWKNWFNLKEQDNRDIDPIFNGAHKLIKKSATYIDSFGQEKTQDCYVVPTAVSKTLSTLNNYKYGTEFLSLFNVDNQFVPIIFQVQGVITTNLDNSVVYCNIDDIRKTIDYTDTNSFNNIYSKTHDILPLNNISIAQPDNDYSFTGLQHSFILINKVPLVYSLIKEALITVFNGLKEILNISKWLTVFALLFVLIIIINMILDNNLMIIAMMKSLGYRINEINLLIIGSYIVSLILAFILGSVLSYVVWNIIVFIVSSAANTILIVPINPITIFLTFGIISTVMVVGYMAGLYLIKFKSVTSLLQGE